MRNFQIDALPLKFLSCGTSNPLKFDPKNFPAKYGKLTNDLKRVHLKEFMLYVNDNSRY